MTIEDDFPMNARVTYSRKWVPGAKEISRLGYVAGYAVGGRALKPKYSDVRNCVRVKWDDRKTLDILHHSYLEVLED